MEKLLRVGVITSQHGVRGEFKVYPTTDDPARFRLLKTVQADTFEGMITLHITSVKFIKNLVILGTEEISTPEKAASYRGADLYIPREEGLPLEPYENYIADLIGLKVVTDTGEDFGELKDVMETGANDVYVIEHGGREYLFPAIRDCILDVDLEKGQMLVHILDGLLDL